MIVPNLLTLGRCLAPDFVGMGNSGVPVDGCYRLPDHQRYLDAWFDAVGVKTDVILVVHDWESALGFTWAQRHPDQIEALVYMEAIVRPFLSWDEWPDATRTLFQALRTSAGEDLILQKNLFIEYLLRFAASPKTRWRSIVAISEFLGHRGCRCSPGRGTCRSKASRRMRLRSSILIRDGFRRAQYRCLSMLGPRAF